MNKKDTKRTSFDLSLENSSYLEAFSKERGISYSTTINDLVNIFLGAETIIKTELAEFCSTKLQKLKENLTKEKMSEFEKQETKLIIAQYQKIRQFFDEEEKTKKPNTNLPEMKRIDLKEGYVVIPDSDNWIILDNFFNPSEHMYVGVVEPKELLDGKHFVFFTDYKYANQYPCNLKCDIFMACQQEEPLFKELLKESIESYPRLFHIVEYGDPTYWDLEPNYEPPYKSMIIRNDL